MILKQAWQKRIKLNNVPLFYDYDYLTEVVQKCKTYNEIKKTVSGCIRFQTPLTQIRIHWTVGSQLYDCPQEAVKELRKRGVEVQMKEADKERTMKDWIWGAWQWQRAGEPEPQSVLCQRIRGKLLEFRRPEDPENT